MDVSSKTTKFFVVRKYGMRHFVAWTRLMVPKTWKEIGLTLTDLLEVTMRKLAQITYSVLHKRLSS